MSKRKHTVEQIIGKLREAEVRLAQGQKVAEACREPGIAEQTYYRWRRWQRRSKKGSLHQPDGAVGDGAAGHR